MKKFKEYSILKNKNYMLLWVARFISKLGDQFHFIAAMWYVMKISGSPMQMGITVICETIPVIIFSPFAGVVADKISRKKILILCDLVSGVLTGALFLAISVGYKELWVIYVITALMAISSTFFGPASQATIPTIVKREELIEANSLSQLSSGITGIIGPAIAAVIISAIGVKFLFAINTVSFVIAAGIESFMKIPFIKNETCGKEQGEAGFWQELKEGFSYSLKNKDLLRLIILGGIVVNFFLAPITVYTPILAEKVYQAGSSGFSIMIIALTVGSILASILVPFFKRKTDYYRLTSIGFVLEGVALILMFFCSNIYTGAGVSFLMGIAVGICNASLGTALQAIIPNHIMGRVSSVFSMICTIVNPIGIFVGSALIGFVSIRLIMLVSGMIVVVCSILGGRLTKVAILELS